MGVSAGSGFQTDGNKVAKRAHAQGSYNSNILNLFHFLNIQLS